MSWTRETCVPPTERLQTAPYADRVEGQETETT